MDTISSFIEKLERELEDVPSGTLKPTTNYRTLESWSSMHSLIIIAFISMEYDVTLNGEDMRSSVTVQQLYDLVKHRKP